MAVFQNIATGLFVSGQLPLDNKTYFNTLVQMRDLGISDYLAFTYYEWMTVVCVETGTRYVWKEVLSGYSAGVLDDNFVYPSDTVTDGIVYSNRIFNFVAETASTSNVSNPYHIYKNWVKNSGDYLEVDDVAEGWWSATEFGKKRYLGGAVNNPSNWAKIDNINPMSYV